MYVCESGNILTCRLSLITLFLPLPTCHAPSLGTASLQLGLRRWDGGFSWTATTPLNRQLGRRC